MPEKMVAAFKSFTEIGWLLPMVGTVEVVGGLLLLFRRTRPLGAVVVVPVLAGALVANISMASPGVPVVLVLMAIVSWVIVDNKEKYLPLISN